MPIPFLFLIVTRELTDSWRTLEERVTSLLSLEAFGRVEGRAVSSGSWLQAAGRHSDRPGASGGVWLLKNGSHFQTGVGSLHLLFLGQQQGFSS